MQEWNLEREHLQALAEEGFDLAAIDFPHVNTSGCVKVRSTNFYAVPLRVGVEVQAKVHSSYVEIWYQGERVARHERCFNRQQKVLNLERYLEALSRARSVRGFDAARTVASARTLAGQF